MNNLDEFRDKVTDNIVAEGIARKTSTPAGSNLIPFGRREDSQNPSSGSIIPADEVEELRSRWNDIQANFVDEPRKAVEDADAFVASAIGRINEGLRQRGMNLQQWMERDDPVTTENLRISLQQYRTFLERLLSI